VINIDYPCKECIVKPVCTKSCELLTKNITVFLLIHKYCPDCGEDKAYMINRHYERKHKHAINLNDVICISCLSCFRVDTICRRSDNNIKDIKIQRFKVTGKCRYTNYSNILFSDYIDKVLIPDLLTFSDGIKLLKLLDIIHFDKTRRLLVEVKRFFWR
jgi:hypothetical protein